MTHSSRTPADESRRPLALRWLRWVAWHAIPFPQAQRWQDALLEAVCEAREAGADDAEVEAVLGAVRERAMRPCSRCGAPRTHAAPDGGPIWACGSSEHFRTLACWQAASARRQAGGGRRQGNPAARHWR